MNANLVGAATFAFWTGVATFFAPCAYPLVPGYIGFFVATASDELRPVDTVIRGLAASVGIILVLAGAAGGLVAVGRRAVSWLVAAEPVVAILLVATGLLLLVDAGPTINVPLPKRRASTLGFLLFGAVYGVAAIGCTIPAVLAVAAAAIALPVAGTAAVIGSFAAGMALVMLSVTVAVGTGHELSGNRLSSYARHARRIGGLVLLLAGLTQFILVLPSGLPW